MSRLGKAKSNEGIAQVLKDAGVSNIPTFGGSQPLAVIPRPAAQPLTVIPRPAAGHDRLTPEMFGNSSRLADIDGGFAKRTRSISLDRETIARESARNVLMRDRKAIKQAEQDILRAEADSKQILQNLYRNTAPSDVAWMRAINSFEGKNGQNSATLGMLKNRAATLSAIEAEFAQELPRATQEAEAVLSQNPEMPTFGAFSGHHGTPHTVDEFKLTKIGTGVGSQVYGWGLYFAELARDADAYRKGLTAQLSFGGPAMVPGERFLPEFAGSKVTWGGWRGGDTLTGNVKVISRRGEPVVSVEVVNGESGKKRWEMDLRHEKQHLTAKLIPTTTGNLYEVSIDAELDALLDWDKPFSEQSEKVRAALSKFDNAEYGGFRASELGKNLYRGIGEIIAKRQGGSVQERGNAAGKLASEWLREAGISGIRYLDEERRNPGTNEPTRNYVIFDEAIIKITARNGSPLSSAERDGVLADLSPVAAGASARAGRTGRAFGSLRSKKHLAADGVAYDPQLATVKVGRVAVDARIEQLGAEEKAHVMRLALFLGDRFGEQVRILFDDLAGPGRVDPMIAGHHTILVSPAALASGVKAAGEGSSLWLKRLGFEEVAHLATFRQIRADLDKSLGHGSTASEFHDHLQERLQAIAGSMTAEQKAWVKDNYGQPLGAQNLASEYLRMLVQVGRQMGGDHGAGLTEAAWMETQTPSAEVRSWLRQVVDAMKKMLRIKPDPQLQPLAVGIDKLLLKMEKAAKKGVVPVVEDEFAAFRRIQAEQKVAQMRGSSERLSVC